MKTSARALLALGLLWWSGATLSNGLQVAPTSLSLEKGRPAAELWLSSSAQVAHFTPMNAQIRIFRWTQINGEDRLLPTQDLVVSPPFVRLEVEKKNQLVRVIRNTQAAQEEGPVDLPGDERAYRIIVDEIPGEEKSAAGLQFVMHYSIPVFVQADGAPSPVDSTSPLPPLVWSWVIVNGQAWVQVENPSAIHAQLAAVVFTDAGGSKHVLTSGLLGYVLPHNKMQWKTSLTPSQNKLKGTFFATVNGHENTPFVSSTR